MKIRKLMAASSIVAMLAIAGGCSKDAEQTPAADDEAAATTETMEESAVSDPQDTDSFEITTGLTAKILRAGDGQVAQAGDNVVVHYTGWLYDETAENNRGAKFDSSVDRGEHFQFPLGAGRVIQGWDQGVQGMKVGGRRRLTIPPDMGYGQFGAGGVIGPNETLVFVVDLRSVG